ncbi:glycosyltransferase [Angustibacter sp. McL0619]|uniref:glycosyltransferase n=1 Tax=Angustibacter sp. McL0619 TaxID=3415676 RepID=UPI003CEF714F
MDGPTQAVVVVPAKAEAELLPGCLDALDDAAGRVAATILVVVAVETGAGPDGTLDVVRRRPHVHAVPLVGALVGEARHAAATFGLDLLGASARPETAQRTWLATTDADSRVPPDWLATQVALATAGADLVLGTVRLPSTARDQVARTWWERYVEVIGLHDHPHVHGANLGVRASTYLACGGFQPVSAHEDALLATAVRQLPGARCITTTASPVTTSDRRLGRTPAGVAADLRDIAAG